MYQSADWIRYALGLPMANSPGTTTNYCTGGVAILGGILQQVSGKTVDEFAEQYLWKLLKINPIQWDRMPTGQINTSGRLFIRPRDMAKIGQLFLNKGQWDGQQLISAGWVEESTRNQVLLRSQEYGYLWWRRQFMIGEKIFPAYYASGNGGHFIVVIPSENLVVVSTAGKPEFRTYFTDFWYDPVWYFFPHYYEYVIVKGTDLPDWNSGFCSSNSPTKEPVYRT
jgi:CubicO group peptidase (beta-lactamase class C family)